MKTCSICHIEKEDTDFYKGFGVCKPCHCARVRLRRRTNPAVQTYERARAKTPARLNQNRNNSKRWRDLYPERYKAHYTVSNAIRDGRLKRGTKCEECGSRAHLHAHHADYSKPLDVQWLCALCHHRHHADV